MGEDSDEKRSVFIGGRITPSLRARLDRIHAKQGTTDAILLADSLEAICNYSESRGFFERPIRVVFDADAASHERLMVAEDTLEPYAKQATGAPPVTAEAVTKARRVSSDKKRQSKPPGAP